MTALPRAIRPTLNPAGLMAAAGLIYAGTSMTYNAVNHHGAWSTPVFISLVGAVASLLTRQVVTPVADPVDGAGRPLVPAVPEPLLKTLVTANMPRADAGLPPLPPQPSGHPGGITRTAPEPPPGPAAS